MWRVGLIALWSACILGCTGSDRGPGRGGAPGDDVAVAPQLEAGRWYPGNHAALQEWLAEVAARPASDERVAVLDWDNTCIVGDVGEAVLWYQLDRLALRLDPEALARFIPAALVEGVAHESGVALSDARSDVLAAYAVLWPLMEAGEVEAARATAEHRDFRAKAAWLYEALVDAEEVGHARSYVWLAGWMSGHEQGAEARTVVTRALEAARESAPARVEWVSATPGRSGLLRHEHVAGLCEQPEMRDLVRALQAAGLRVYVVSASSEPSVEVAADLLGYSIEPDSIFGIRHVVEGGRFTAIGVDPGTYPITYGQGKVDLIRALLPASPIFVAGDADTDFEMLTSFEETEVRLLINRNRGGHIGSLYGDALRPTPPGGPVTLLQGRDDNACAFRPHRETIPLGETAGRVRESSPRGG